MKPDREADWANRGRHDLDEAIKSSVAILVKENGRLNPLSYSFSRPDRRQALLHGDARWSDPLDDSQIPAEVIAVYSHEADRSVAALPNIKFESRPRFGPARGFAGYGSAIPLVAVSATGIDSACEYFVEIASMTHINHHDQLESFTLEWGT